MDAIDTQILIWGVKKEQADGRPDMVPRCIALLEMLKQQRHIIMVPSIVVAEYLADFPPERQEEQRRIIGKNFFVAPFDAAAATVAGAIYSKAKMKSARAKTPACRQCVHADLKIIATAIAHGAKRLYTDNTPHFVTLAVGKILVDDIPPLEKLQQGLSFGA